MKIFNLGVHLVTSGVFFASSFLLLIFTLMLGGIGLMFGGNLMHVFFLAVTLLVGFAGVHLWKGAFANAALFGVDVATYRSAEIRLALIGLAICVVQAIFLLLFNSFSVQEAVKYGYGFVLFIIVGLLALNTVSLLWTASALH
ncbi:MAG: hypothetical protein IJ092_08655 [Atopobiaceae bacterium]|nr:hypothetical protein [Atopobiaceae bacterium]MBR1830102.1 hypothetical protein [Atopobiaceae bacterium]